MLLGSSVATNGSTFVGCAHAWATIQNALPTPVGKCYIFNNKGIAFNSFEPIVLNRRTIPFQKTTSGRLRIPLGRPLHSHLMSGFSSTFINVINLLQFIYEYFLIMKMII